MYAFSIHRTFLIFRNFQAQIRQFVPQIVRHLDVALYDPVVVAEPTEIATHRKGVVYYRYSFAGVFAKVVRTTMALLLYGTSVGTYEFHISL